MRTYQYDTSADIYDAIKETNRLLRLIAGVITLEDYKNEIRLIYGVEED